VKEAALDSATAGTSNSPSSLPGLIVAAAIAAGALLFGTVIVRSLNPDTFNYDVAWVLYCAEQILDGARLYVDLIDENPPLIFWLSVPPVALARLLGAPVVLVFNLLVALLALLSATLSYRALRWSRGEATPGYALALVVGLGCLTLILPARDFGQREHLMSIAVLPYLFAASARASGRRLPARSALAVGLLAGLGFAIKPYFLLVWIAVELYVARTARGGWRCPENALIVGIHAIYAPSVLLFAPAYLDVVAMTTQVLSSYKEWSPLTLLSPTAVIYVALAGGLFAMIRPSSLDRELRGVLLTASVALLACAIMQGTSWRYHFLPAELMALLLIGVISLGLVSHADSLRRLLRPPVAALPTIIVLLLSLWCGATLLRISAATFGWAGEPRSLIRALTRIVEERAPGQAIWLMSTSVNPAFPVVNLSGASWSSRFCCIWLAPALYTDAEKATRPFPYHDRDEMTELERFQIDAVIEDLEAAPPKLLIVDQSASKQAWGRTGFEFLPYFRRDPRFSDFFWQYRRVDAVGPFRIYELQPGTE